MISVRKLHPPEVAKIMLKNERYILYDSKKITNTSAAGNWYASEEENDMYWFLVETISRIARSSVTCNLFLYSRL